ncbi:HEAT repeat domain-containing protein [Planctomycetota bacterium]
MIRRKQLIYVILLLLLALVTYYVSIHSQFINILRVKKAIQSGKTENVIPFLTIDDMYIQLYAVRGLGEIRDARAIERIIQTARTTHFQHVQLECISILGQIKNKQGLKGLMTIIDFDNSVLRAEVIDEINKLIDKKNRNLVIEKLKEWWRENKDYLYWSEKDGHFVIDQEAKAAGIPTEEYRKTHPWPEENESKPK